jgi:hypothetical protein
MEAKYEGGIFGHNKTMKGTLSFDDTNQRLLFRNDKNMEMFFIPYGAVSATFADTQKAAARRRHSRPVRSLYFWAARTDQDQGPLPDYSIPRSRTNVAGITSFRLANKDLLDSVVYALANQIRFDGAWGYLCAQGG